WGLKLPTLRQRLFRCVSIRENDDGTYAITAVQHVPEKEAIVDNGAHFDGDQSGTVNGVTPPAVQHLTAEVTADSGEYQVLARWDTPKVVKGVSFLLRLTVTADDGSERLVSTARTTETTYRFTQLALGNYRLTVRAVNARGQQGDPASVSFRIAMINPANGNTKPMFVGQGDQIFMNDVFLKRLTAPTITSGGNPPAFSLTPDGRLTAKNADISGNVNANSGALNNVTINENCRVLGKLSANQIEGDLVKTVGKAFPRDSRAPERWPSGTITVRVYDDQPFDRQ
ncbi:TPA: hypothetical protein GFZ60_26105, partial [Escherichia coli]|nr:hypothetical protein [Escherichia coli]